jgi:hypothetical protein
MCAKLYSIQLRETMNDDWKEWDVVETVRTTEIPGFMAPTGGAVTLLEGARQCIRNEWKEFVDLLNAGGHGTGYERLLTLRKNMEARKEELSKEIEKCEDRGKWLRKLKGVYVNKLQRLADVTNPEAIWRTRGVNDPIDQLDCANELPADQPIVETFLDFDEDGRLVEQRELEHGWQAYAENIPIGTGLDDLAQQFATDTPDLHRENVTVSYSLSDRKLERAGIDPENLESSRSAINMKSTTTWREALLQIEEREQSVSEEKGPPERTIRVLDFRLRILGNVLYQFETFGSVERMTEEEAEKYVSESALAREYARAVVEIYEEVDQDFSSRSALLTEVAIQKNIPNQEADSKVQHELEKYELYPKGTSGGTLKAEQRRLLFEMVERCRDFICENKTTEQNET